MQGRKGKEKEEGPTSLRLSSLCRKKSRHGRVRCYTDAMKHLRLLCALLLALAVLFPESALAKQAAKEGVTALGDANPVVSSLKNLKAFNGKPNPKAKFYFYLCSASWCGPCQREMPAIVKLHKAMKRDGRADIILVGYDRSLDEAKAYLKSHKAKFAGVWEGDEHIKELPGYVPVPAVPYVIMVDCSGKTLAVRHASMLKDWKTVVDNAEKNAAAPADEAL